MKAETRRRNTGGVNMSVETQINRDPPGRGEDVRERSQ